MPEQKRGLITKNWLAIAIRPNISSTACTAVSLATMHSFCISGIDCVISERMTARAALALSHSMSPPGSTFHNLGIPPSPHSFLLRFPAHSISSTFLVPRYSLGYSEAGGDAKPQEQVLKCCTLKRKWHTYV